MSSKSPRNGVGLCLALFLLFAVVLACSRGSNKCTATLTYEGKTYTGIGKKDEAVSFACNKYCLADDSEYDAMYRIWLDSAEGRAAADRRKRKRLTRASACWILQRSPARTGASAGQRVVELKQRRSVIS